MNKQPYIVKYIFVYFLEILGIEPKITKCKFVVLPVKLYPLLIITVKSSNKKVTLSDISDFSIKKFLVK